MATQWNYAASGQPIGLRYEVLPFAMRSCGISRDHFRDTTEMVLELEQDMLKRARNG